MKILLLAVATLAAVGCTDDAPATVETAPVDEIGVSPPTDAAAMDTTMTDDEMMMDEPLNSEMTEGEVLTDDAM